MNTLLRERRFAFPLLGCFLLVVAGCGKSVTLAPVSGMVTVDGQALTAGQVSLIPQGATEPTSGKSNLSAGTIDSSGKYTIYTDGRSGAPLGKYKVVVTPSMMPSAGKEAPPRAFNTKYSDRTKTDLEIEVIEKAQAGKYDLKLSK
jgi:hypothetical protein